MLLRRMIEHVKAQNWTAVALDFIIVVMGVFIGVQVNGWWASQYDARRELAYLEALESDFGVIVRELEDDSAEYAMIADAMTFLLEQSRMETPDASFDALNSAARLLIRMIGTPIASGTYENLTGSGDLSLIANRQLKDAMSSFYSQSKVINLIGDTHEMQLVNLFQPYIIAHLDYPGMLTTLRGMKPAASFEPEAVLEALETKEFRNIVAIKWDIVTDIRDIIEASLEDARAVQSLLETEIKESK